MRSSGFLKNSFGIEMNPLQIPNIEINLTMIKVKMQENTEKRLLKARKISVRLDWHGSLHLLAYKDIL